MNKKEFVDRIALIINAETPEFQSKEINKLYRDMNNTKRMSNLERQDILIEVKKRISEKRLLSGEYETIQDKYISGEYETIQDKYIDIICKEKGYNLTDFYSIDGKMLNKLFNKIK